MTRLCIVPGLFNLPEEYLGASQVVVVIKNPSANEGDIRDVDSIPGSGRFPGGEHGNPSSIFAWRIPRTEEHGRLWSTGSQRI